MNRFEHICATCPLRTKVDVTRASESDDWRAPDDVCQLSDGVRTYKVRKAIDEDEAICDRPKTGLLRRKCGMGLATAWRWSEVVGAYTPNVTRPDDLIPFLDEATYQDAMPHYADGAWLFGDPPEYSELHHHDPAFTNCSIKKLTQRVRGTHAELTEGKAVMLDRISWAIDDERLHDVFRIRIAQGGPHFAFRSDLPLPGDKQEYANNIQYIFAEGVHAYLFSDPEAIAQSDALLNAAHAMIDQRRREIPTWLSRND